jgi:hypothetical protein
MYLRSKVLSMGIIVFLIFGLLAGGCAAKETALAPNPEVTVLPTTTPAQPTSTTVPLPRQPTPDAPISVLPKVSSSGPWPPIIDAHAHLVGGPYSEQTAYVDQLVAEMNRLGIVKATLEGMSPPRNPNIDKDILAACKRYPDRFYPYLSGFDPQDEGAVEYVKKQLETGEWRGLGEIILRHAQAGKRNPADHPVMLKIYDLCAEYNVPIHIHFEPGAGIDYEQGIEEIKRALALSADGWVLYAATSGEGVFRLELW